MTYIKSELFVPSVNSFLQVHFTSARSHSAFSSRREFINIGIFSRSVLMYRDE
jgi:hypothetical protein